MASEVLKRNPTSTGNRRVFTWAGWVKFNKLSTVANCIWYAASSGSSEFNISLVSSTGALNVYDYATSAYQYQYVTSRLLRDFSNWFHLVVAVDTTQFREDDRFKIYINGALYNGSYSIETTTGGINHQTRMNTPGEINTIGQNVSGGVNYDANCELADMFMVDGQALTPDVFGFYKEGKGYISAGSTQATDFRPGQWVPKTPRVIKTEINRRGGFGVNGFYLPMNDSKNFGADFHCEPNSIIKLNEELPQPRVGVATTASVGLGYTNALRADPYAANLVLALPFVSGGLQSGLGDYSHIIRNSGVAKTITASNISIASTASYYGNAAGQFTSSSTPTSRYINISSNSDFNMGTGDFTVETWVKLDSVSSGIGIWFGANQGSPTTYWQFGFKSPSFSGNNGPYVWYNAGDVVVGSGQTTGQWDHVAWTRKGTVMTLWLNGVAVGINTNVTTSVDLNGNSNPQIGAYNSNIDQYNLNGYLQDFRIYKGVAKYTGGFDVPKPYTPVGIATWRAVPDSTANNFATLNPLNNGYTLSNGNLTFTNGASNKSSYSTIGVSTGKWYAELYWSAVSGTQVFGIAKGAGIGTFNTNYVGFFADSWAYGDTSRFYNNNSFVTYGSNISSTDIVGLALDLDNRTLSFYKNGTSLGVATSGLSTDVYFIGSGSYSSTGSINFGQNPTFSGNTTAGTFTDSNGKGLFKYQPPSGFLALCEDNLPTPAISDPGDYFKTVLYTGTGASRNIVGVGFTPDLVWIKSRSSTNYHFLFDSVRGASKFLFSNATTTETTTASLLSFDSDGYSVTTDPAPDTSTGWNKSGENTVAWCWRAGAGTTSTNTDGSIQSVISVNQTAGFSIVSYTGNSSSPVTIGHGLGKKPSFIIVRNRDLTSTWYCYHSALGATQRISLESTAAAFSGTGLWNSTEPSSTVFTTVSDTATNSNGSKHIAYCWAEIEGFSKAFSFVGNGSDDGPFVYCNFKPAFILIKRSDAVGSWAILDSARNSTNVVDRFLWSNLTDIEGTYTLCDFLSNGFKIRNVSNGYNASGGTYIGMAFSESPFTTANAK